MTKGYGAVLNARLVSMYGFCDGSGCGCKSRGATLERPGSNGCMAAMPGCGNRPVHHGLEHRQRNIVKPQQLSAIAIRKGLCVLPFGE
jgi:hypothetical protein